MRVAVWMELVYLRLVRPTCCCNRVLTTAPHKCDPTGKEVRTKHAWGPEWAGCPAVRTFKRSDEKDRLRQAGKQARLRDSRSG